MKRIEDAIIVDESVTELALTKDPDALRNDVADHYYDQDSDLDMDHFILLGYQAGQRDLPIIVVEDEELDTTYYFISNVGALLVAIMKLPDRTQPAAPVEDRNAKEEKGDKMIGEGDKKTMKIEGEGGIRFEHSLQEVLETGVADNMITVHAVVWTEAAAQSEQRETYALDIRSDYTIKDVLDETESFPYNIITEYDIPSYGIKAATAVLHIEEATMDAFIFAMAGPDPDELALLADTFTKKLADVIYDVVVVTHDEHDNLKMSEKEANAISIKMHAEAAGRLLKSIGAVQKGS
jgi:hypothetical protein